jgi:SAM-dependent methyltransferase
MESKPVEIFMKSARLYNILQAEKDYRQEAAYIDRLLKKFRSPKANTVLNIGCGTGLHDRELALLGYRVDGIDLSPEMIAEARKQSSSPLLNFQVGEASSFQTEKSYDAVISLFHVMGYLTENIQLFTTFQNIFSHLSPGGLFIFDFWYGPGVLSEPPSQRTKSGEDELFKVSRSSVPTLYPVNNRVDVAFEFNVHDKLSNTDTRFRETHKLRYFFFPELKFMLEQSGFKKIELRCWMDENNEPDLKAWYACIIATK